MKELLKPKEKLRKYVATGTLGATIMLASGCSPSVEAFEWKLDVVCPDDSDPTVGTISYPANGVSIDISCTDEEDQLKPVSIEIVSGPNMELGDDIDHDLVINASRRTLLIPSPDPYILIETEDSSSSQLRIVKVDTLDRVSSVASQG